MPRSIPAVSILADSCGAYYAYYFTLIVICGLPVKTTCPWALRTVRLGTVTVVEPLAMPWKIRLVRTPEPDTPGVLGRRFRFMAAAPASFWMFLVNNGVCPSLEKKSPRPASFSLTTLESKLICRGAEETSVAFSMMRATVTTPCGLVSTCGGRKRTTALPTGLGVPGWAGSPAGGAVAGGAIPGAPIGGAVAGGVRPGAAAAGAVAGGTITGAPIVGGVSGGAARFESGGFDVPEFSFFAGWTAMFGVGSSFLGINTGGAPALGP